MQMQQMMRAMGQTDFPEIVPILEINPDHAIVSKLKDTADDAVFEDISFLLFEQAMLVEGQQLKEPAEFVKRLNRMIVITSYSIHYTKLYDYQSA